MPSSPPDESRPVREEDAVDAAAVVGWLRGHTSAPVPDGLPEVRQFPGGASNLTYLLRWPHEGAGEGRRELHPASTAHGSQGARSARHGP